MKKKKILIIEPHSDDGVIAIGGFLEKFKDIYEYYFCLITASDLNMHHVGHVSRQQRLDEYKAYVEHFNGFWYKGNSDNELPLDQEANLDLFPKKTLVKHVEKAIESTKPDIIMIQGPSFHHDHTAVYEATIAATRPTGRVLPAEIYVLENPTYVHSIDSSTTFNPDTYISLTDEQLESKLRCFRECFPSQIRENENYLSDDGLRSWARYRGIEARTKYAEAIHTYLRVI